MKIKDLIEVLKTMPQDQPLWHVWDGKPRTKIEFVWVSRNRQVMSADFNETVYLIEDRPLGSSHKGDWCMTPEESTPQMKSQEKDNVFTSWESKRNEMVNFYQRKTSDETIPSDVEVK